MEPERKIILSIETAIEGGSISIIEGKDEIDFWIGNKESLKAEVFLLEISKILDKNKIEKKNIKSIIVSNGPGSSTGLKIGLATARGLGTALNCEVIEISLFEAVLKFVNMDENCKAFVILPVSKNLFFLKKVKFVNLNPLKEFEKTLALTIEKLIEELKLLSNIQIIIHRKTFESYNNLMSGSIKKSNNLIVFEDNMAFILAKNTTHNNASDKK
ncbi:MAG: tRNA (adenosine(37)-N6)-threonylcarbamoyltransferase complex dimerization subunit type 1 TsaB [Acidobacteria bacterium]|nr:tRNA (adenosine(37)-N6)-threonylcarbamoyltransferase complex dimerization subunit type 1 TsaB [Acidobacteriota bacterium]